jgi:TolB protein
MDEPVPVLEPVLPRRPRRVGRVVAVLALVAVVAVVVVWVALFRPGRAGPDGPRLVVIETGGGLATMDGFGQSLARRELPGTRLQFPAWSPDGSRIAAIGNDGATAAIHVFDVAGDTDRPPTTIYESADRPPFYLYWTPDSQQVTFLTSQPAPTAIALRVAPADGSSEAEIVREAAPFYWDFVDPARLLLHTGATGSGAFVGEVDLEGASFEASAIESGLFRAPAVGGDGRSRAYVMPAGADPTDGQQIVVEARDGSTRHEIPVDGSVALSFDPTSTALAYIASDERTDSPPPIPIGPLRTIDATSGDVRTLLDAEVLAFFWSPDGRTIATLDLRPDDGPDPGEAGPPGRHLASSAIGGLPPLAVDAAGVGLHLAFVDVATAEVRAERDVQVSELFAFQVLPFFDQYALSHRFWAPDGSGIALPLAEDNGVERVFVIPADGSDPRAVAIGSIGFWRP